ncbi:phage major capsid protein, partial [Streptosporangium sp. NPDC003464]
MPVNPPAPPSLSGDLLSIHRLLASPTQIQRRLRTIADLRFISDQILTQRFRSSGGAVLYEVSEPIFNTRSPQAVGPGSEYPHDVTANGAAALASVSKWGQATRLTDEAIKRNARPGDEVDRVLRKVINTVIRHVDGITMSAVASAVTQTQAAGDDWIATTATILRDIELAKAKIAELQMG